MLKMNTTGFAEFTSDILTTDDNALTLVDDVDPTKKAKFQLSGITTGTIRTLTLPNVDGGLASLGNVAQTFAGQTAFSKNINDFGNSTATGTTGLAMGATISGATKTVNIGTGGVSGSTTTITIGSATSAGHISLTQPFTPARYTWATKPATATTGDIIHITDIGPTVAPMVWNGTAWRAKEVIVLAQKGTGASILTGTAEVTLATVTIPAGLMGPNSALRISAFWTCSATANAKVIRVRFDGNQSMGITLSTGSTVAVTTGCMIYNRNATNSQITSTNASTFYGANTAGYPTFAIDTSVAKDITLTGRPLVDTTDWIILEAYTVELLPGT